MLAICFSVFALAVTTARAQTPLNLKPRDQSIKPAPPKPRLVPDVNTRPPKKTREEELIGAKPGKQLKQLDRAIGVAKGKSKALKTKAKSLDQDIQRLRQGMISAAWLVQDHEKRVSALTEQLAKVTQVVTEKEKTLRRRRKQMGKVILALHRVAQYPAEALIVRPISPGDTVRSAILLRATVPELERQAIALRDDLDALRQNRAEALRHKDDLLAAKTELEGQRKLLRTLIGRKSRLRRRTLAKSNVAQQKVRKLAKQARSIRDLMARLEALRLKREQQAKDQIAAGTNTKTNTKANVKGAPNLQRPKDFTGKPMETARGHLPYPVVGSVVAGFGENVKTGLSHKGLTIEASSGAQVIAPYEGRVAFSGPFRGYGELLIIEHREGYHTLLAGMSRIDGIVGQWLLAGEPVGVMGTAVSGQQKDKPTLYLEMRHKGQPINPLPWLVSRKG